MEDLGARTRQHKGEGDGRDIAGAHDGDEGLAPGRWGDGVEEGIPVDSRGGLEHIPSNRHAWILVRDMVEEDGLLGVAIGECMVRHPLEDRTEGTLKVGMGHWVHRAREVTLSGQVLALP